MRCAQIHDCSKTSARPTEGVDATTLPPQTPLVCIYFWRVLLVNYAEIGHIGQDTFMHPDALEPKLEKVQKIWKGTRARGRKTFLGVFFGVFCLRKVAPNPLKQVSDTTKICRQSGGQVVLHWFWTTFAQVLDNFLALFWTGFGPGF